MEKNIKGVYKAAEMWPMNTEFMVKHAVTEEATLMSPV